VLQFQPTSTLHQVCNPTTQNPHSVLQLIKIRNLTLSEDPRILKHDVLLGEVHPSTKMNLKSSLLTSKFKTYFEALPEFEGPVQAMAPSDHTVC
jgi:hypothetical protein